MINLHNNSNHPSKKLSKSLQSNNLLQIIMQAKLNNNKNLQLKKNLNKNLLRHKLRSQRSPACRLKSVGKIGKEILKMRLLIRILNKKNSRLKITEKIFKRK